ncbi:Uncharacterised protein [Vibrio cholerae]|nr:Uncharacterised protein [Vibrio cholerae]CSD13468.1 Uncharacterised protein [Vibrio cholerae]
MRSSRKIGAASSTKPNRVFTRSIQLPALGSNLLPNTATKISGIPMPMASAYRATAPVSRSPLCAT